MPRFKVTERTKWKWWVTPKPLENKPVHSWYVFPHSFSNELVESLIDEWNLSKNSKILDPFSGAGTTLLTAKQNGYNAWGFDLSPLAVFVSKAKTNHYNPDILEKKWLLLEKRLHSKHECLDTSTYPDLVKKALPRHTLNLFANAYCQLQKIKRPYSDFFLLGLLSILPLFSRAVATGGWLKWRDSSLRSSAFLPVYSSRILKMIEDVKNLKLNGKPAIKNRIVDSRNIPADKDFFDAVITSPPYPNRHDYTRVFGVELMFAFLDWEKTRALRYQSFHSHPESHPERPSHNGYVHPDRLQSAIAKLSEKKCDHRIISMISGYFTDMYLTLKELERVCKTSAKIAFVVGNAQYSGIPIIVDEFTAEVGEQAGLKCKEIRVVRYRGNSAQQMKMYGRNPSRESIVIFEKQSI